MRLLSDERPILNYAKPPRTSGAADGFRMIGAAVCVFAELAGLGIIWFGATAFVELPGAPTRDRPYYIFVGSVVCLIGLLVAGFSVRWLVSAIRPKRNVTIDGPPSVNTLS